MRRYPSNSEWDLSQPVRWSGNETKMVENALLRSVEGLDRRLLIEALLPLLIETREQCPAEERHPFIERLRELRDAKTGKVDWEAVDWDLLDEDLEVLG